ncbi:MAG: UDP-2,4-diacetamido-2,4,6-trideoxy-beta-L-altropyranose hydrolase, partial [Candidatus Omnitrophica bacterium]|nr:UDP-2,4-diacetamido-2,4,6-trideoxy-beta-L-altropyranose hydrolase [Candidatus Omnitrophota bacterium]
MNILFRCDANNEIGIGHGIRSLALAQAFKAKGDNTCFIFNDISANLLDIFVSEKVRAQKINTESGSRKDAEETKKQTRQFKADWIIADGYAFGTAYQNIIKEGGLKLLCIDDMASCEFAADIILNQNPGFRESDYKCTNNAKLLLGPEYIILRQEFVRFERSGAEVSPRLERIFLNMGGADKNNVTGKVLKALNHLDFNIRVTAVMGPANIHRENLEKMHSQLNYEIDLIYNPKSVISHMLNSDLAIHACGTTSWELAYLGIPSISVIVSDNQVPVAESLAS